MALLTEDRLANIIDIPVSLPATQLLPGAYVLVGSIEVISPQTLAVRELQLQIANIEAAPTDINPDFLAGSLACLLIIAGFAPDTAPNVQAYSLLLAAPTDFNTALTTAAPIIVAVDPAKPIVLSNPGVYSIIVLNNSNSTVTAAPIPGTLDVAVTGAVTIDLSPNQVAS
jgi:hypothetical protein